MMWRQSNFAIVHELVGSCMTADEAYRVLRQREMEMQYNIDFALNENDRQKSVVSEALQSFAEGFQRPSDEILAGCFVNGARLSYPIGRAQLLADRVALEFTQELITRIQPMRKYSDLPDSEAHQICQREETLLKFLKDAYLSIVCEGYLNPKILLDINNHPDRTKAFPILDKLRACEDLINLDLHRLLADTFTDAPLLPRPEQLTQQLLLTKDSTQ